jgi:hypothetical protein
MCSITITPDDPRWVGAWWIGYLVGCAGAISVFFTLLPYPKEFKCESVTLSEAEVEVFTMLYVYRMLPVGNSNAMFKC